MSDENWTPEDSIILFSIYIYVRFITEGVYYNSGQIKNKNLTNKIYLFILIVLHESPDSY